MASKTGRAEENRLPCTWQPQENCQGCQAKGQLMCRLERQDMLHFFMIILPFGVTTIVGTIRAGFGVYLWPWLVYALFFFFVWEAGALCRHCPYWAEAGKTLHCHANFGVYKIWEYQPGPMSRGEKIQFLAGALILLAYPFPFLVLAQESLLVIIALVSAVSGVFILRKNVCSRCINFSCPLNAVPKSLVDAYLRRNPHIRAAWEDNGYRLG